MLVRTQCCPHTVETFMVSSVSSSIKRTRLFPLPSPLCCSCRRAIVHLNTLRRPWCDVRWRMPEQLYCCRPCFEQHTTLFLFNDVEAEFLRPRRQENLHLACDDPEAWRTCGLVLQQGVTVEAVDTSDAVFILFSTSCLITSIQSMISVGSVGCDGVLSTSSQVFAQSGDERRQKASKQATFWLRYISDD